uniref:Uncharacterized protein n=1 Tax=Chinchilla lanigera TaxID=34839 RepID=A0A8C2VXE6_CHILA
MDKHHPDLIFCQKQAGAAIGRRDKCDGKCVICDSYVRPCTLVRICGGSRVFDAYYWKVCTTQEKDQDGYLKIINLGSSKTDLFYEHKRKYGFKKK